MNGYILFTYTPIHLWIKGKTWIAWIFLQRTINSEGTHIQPKDRRIKTGTSQVHKFIPEWKRKKSIRVALGARGDFNVCMSGRI